MSVKRRAVVVSISIAVPLAVLFILSPLLATTCATSGRQVVRGVVTRAGTPLAGFRLIISGDPYRCTKVIKTVVTDDAGRFQLSQQVSYGVLAVHVQGLALCEEGSSAPLWSMLLGPAPKDVEFICDLALPEPCTARADGSVRESLRELRAPTAR